MKKIFALLIIILAGTTVSAEIEQHQGFPVGVGEELQAFLLVQDINGDAKLEIIAVPENRIVKVFYHNGTLNWENTGGKAQYDYGRFPLVSDLNGDSLFEILSYGNPGWSDATFHIWDAAGNNLLYFPVGKYIVISSPSITQDGTILTGAAPGVSFSTIVEGTGLHAFNSQGTKLWYLELGKSVNFQAMIQVSDLDEDGIDEAVVLTQNMNDAAPIDGKVWLIKANSTTGTILWSRETGGDARNAAIGDVNGDGIKEIVAVSSGGVYIYDRDGNELNKFAVNNNPDTPSIGDIDNNGVDEVLIASSDDNRIYIISNGTLNSFYAERITSNLALGDLNDDGNPEIAGGDLYGNMYIWDNMGRVLDKRNIARKYYYFTSATIADLEGDGNKEIILGNKNGNIFVYTFRNQPPDMTAPETTDNTDDSWHNSSVTVVLIPYDSQSGVGATYYSVDGSVESQGTTIAISSEGNHTIRYYSIDNAGNREADRFAYVKLDFTAPVTTDNADDTWHNSSVTATLETGDSDSGIAATYYSVDGSVESQGTTIAISSEGNHTIRYYSIDNAGNKEADMFANVKIDLSAPATTDNADDQWHNSSVTVTLMPDDAESGISATYYSVDGSEEAQGTTILISGEGNHTIRYYSVDNAGNKEADRFTNVRIDTVPPSTTDDSDGEWHNSSVTVKLSSLDDLSGINAMNYQVKSIENMAQLFWAASTIGLGEISQNIIITISEEGIFDILYQSVDNAGNMEPQKSAKPVRLDKTSPMITGKATVPPNANGWYNSDVTINFTAEDALSGIKTLTTEQILGLEGASQSVTGTAVDMAGNSAGFTLTGINIDKTSPLITGIATTSPNANGWYNGNITVHFDCSDALSGVENCTQDSIVSTEEAGQVVSGAAEDKAGNNASTLISGINLDKTQPVIIVNSPLNRTYLHSDIITLNFSAQDTLSGIYTVNSIIDGSIQVPDGQIFDMLELSFGTHEFIVEADDNASNQKSERVSFSVIATIDSLQALTERGISGSGIKAYRAQISSGSWITSAGVANSLMAKLDSARQKMESGEISDAKSQIEAYINQVEAQAGNSITAQGASILVAEANYVIEHL